MYFGRTKECCKDDGYSLWYSFAVNLSFIFNPTKVGLFRWSVGWGGAVGPPLRHFFIFSSCGPKFVLIQANYLLYRVWSRKSWNTIFFGRRHHFCLWRHSMGIYRKMTSCDVTWRQHVGFSPNLQEMFLLLIWSYGENMKSFAPFSEKLLIFLYFQL